MIEVFSIAPYPGVVSVASNSSVEWIRDRLRRPSKNLQRVLASPAIKP